jgi:molecular chaperone IbpA
LTSHAVGRLVTVSVNYFYYEILLLKEIIMTLSRLDLSPLFRSSVGFDRFSSLFDTMMRGADSAPSYPPYNIEKLPDDQYRVVLAVAGFKEQDITITVKDNLLSISGKIEEPKDKSESTFLYKGIASRAFEFKFGLADHVKVTHANLADGLLTIDMHRELPEESKPRMIPINGQTAIDAKKTN